MNIVKIGIDDNGASFAEYSELSQLEAAAVEDVRASVAVPTLSLAEIMGQQITELEIQLIELQAATGV